MLRMIIGAIVVYFVFWILNRVMNPAHRSRRQQHVRSRESRRKNAIDADFEELDDR